MSKKQLRTAASSGRAASGAFTSPSSFGGNNATFGVASSSLSYIAEPPDLSHISDPQVVVSFKNLLKKDSVTKAKALADIKDYLSKPQISEEHGVEDGILEAWVNLYPRTSIDTSRRVRQLAHILQGSLGVLCGKRIAKYMPKVVGAWIAGQYDNDRLVSRAAQDSLAQVFTTEEKRHTVWRAYRSAILKYVDDAALQQTALTLSDERTVNPDDALAKHVRVAGSAIFLLKMLLNEPKDNVSIEDRLKLKNILQDKELWEYASHSDPFLRRATYGLLQTCLRSESFEVNLRIISMAVISKALHISQLGSALDFSETLLVLTEKHPDVWTTSYFGKTSAARRLRQYLKRGSQSGPPQFWTNISRILRLVPTATLSVDVINSSSSPSLQEAEGLANCFIEGITQKEEPRFNLGTAWSAYICTSLWITNLLSETKDLDHNQAPRQGLNLEGAPKSLVVRSTFLARQLLPLISQYIRPAPVTSQWSIHSPKASTICAECLTKITGETFFDLEEFWRGLTDSLIEEMRLSLPAQSRGFKDSQDAIVTLANRWFSFESEVLALPPPQPVQAHDAVPEGVSESLVPPQKAIEVFRRSTWSLIESAIQLLESRNGKPHGCAAIIHAAVRYVPQLVFEPRSGSSWTNDSAQGPEQDAVLEGSSKSQIVSPRRTGSTIMAKFLKEGVPSLIGTPSSDLITSVLIASKGREGYEEGLNATIEAYLAGNTTLPGYSTILSQVDLPYLPSFPQVYEVVLDSLRKALHKSTSKSDTEWSETAAFFSNVSIPFQVAEKTINIIVNQLLSGENVEMAMTGIEVVCLHSQSKMKEYLTSVEGPRLLSRLIVLCESPNDETARRASALQASIRFLLVEQGGKSLTARSTAEIIDHNLRSADENSLSMDTLVEQAKAIIADAPTKDGVSLAQQIYPSRVLWEASLGPFLEVPPSKAMAITDTLGGAINAVTTPSQGRPILKNIQVDPRHFSIALRLTIFVLRLISDVDILKVVDNEQRASTYLYFPLAIQIIDDNLTIAGSYNAWNMYADETENEMADLVSNGRRIMARWTEEPSALNPAASSDPLGEDFLDIWKAQLDNASGSTPLAFHIGRCYARIFATVADTNRDYKFVSHWQEWKRGIRSTTNIFYAAGFSAAFKTLIASIPEGRRLNNELIADLTGLSVTKAPDEVLRKLVLFNIVTYGEDGLLNDVPKQRLVFLVKHLVEWLKSKDPRPTIAVQAEALKSLTTVLPYIKDIYGSYWQDILKILEVLVEDPASDSSLQWTQAFLKMISILRSLINDEESNDDLKDSWEAWSGDGLPTSLAAVLHCFDDPGYRVNQPRNIVTDALARQISLSGVRCNVGDMKNMYRLLRAESPGVQKASSTLILRYLSDAQEILSVQLGASGETARLPDELSTLLLETPNLEILAELRSEERMWLNIRGYLLSWKAVFDHFNNASHKVQTDYVEYIKEGGYLISFLTFLFDLLGHAIGRPVDGAKFAITTYIFDSQETSEKDVQSLSIYLYYLCLIHLPTITKAWWIDSKKRIKGPVESWTQKFISTHVIASAFKAVSDWEHEGAADSEQYRLEIKISPKASELTASIAVDEAGDSPPISIVISLPPAYPLQPAAVFGRQRVVVDDKKWKGWLLTIQGVIMFHGNLADGLMAFRKNVQGALKGQSECAICYSVISSDMQTPNKTCVTCKNMFHSSCLFRWFRSSNSSSCPLCRNSFNYG